MACISHTYMSHQSSNCIAYLYCSSQYIHKNYKETVFFPLDHDIYDTLRGCHFFFLSFLNREFSNSPQLTVLIFSHLIMSPWMWK